MSRLLLNLRHVPDDEADEVRAMLEEAEIAFYETPPNRWGITVGGIWVRDREDHRRAKALMAEYQAGRLERARAEHERRRQAGELESIGDRIRERPLQALGAVAATAFIVYLMLLPFIGLGG